MQASAILADDGPCSFMQLQAKFRHISSSFHPLGIFLITTCPVVINYLRQNLLLRTDCACQGQRLHTALRAFHLLPSRVLLFTWYWTMRAWVPAASVSNHRIGSR